MREQGKAIASEVTWTQFDIEPEAVIAVLTDVLGSASTATSAVGGRIGFDVAGPNGGQWSVDLDQPGGQWTKGIDGCDVALQVRDRVFANVFLEPECIAQLVEFGQLAVRGRTELFSRLGEMLNVGGGQIALRTQLSKRARGPK